MSFMEIIKYYRKRAGLSQSDLADKLGVARTTIASYEQGRRHPDFETEEKIADFFNIDLNTLRGVSVPALDNDAKELLSIYRSLDTDSKANLLAFARYLGGNYGN